MFAALASTALLSAIHISKELIMVKHAPQLRDGRTPGWFYLDDALIDTHGQVVGAIGIAVYAALARHAKANGRAIVSYDQLADSLDLSRNTVIRKLHLLAESGLISISPQTDDAGNPIAANVYTLCIIPEQKRENRKRGVPTDAPPHATSEPPVPTDERGVPTDAYIGHDSISNKRDHDPPPPPNPPQFSGGGGGGGDLTETERLLLQFSPEPFSVAAAHEFCNLPPDLVRAELARAHASRTGPGALVKRWRKIPPEDPPPPLAAPVRQSAPPLAPGVPASQLREWRDKYEKEHRS